MSIATLEQASAFGALDADAIADGTSYSALVARNMGRQANRLLAKRHTLLSLIWPMTSEEAGDYSQYRAEWLASTADELILPPMTIRKKPGIVAADVYLRVYAASGVDVEFRLQTRAQQQRLQQVLTVVGTGAWAWATRELVLDSGELEELHVYARTGNDNGALMDTGTYGSPATGTIDSGDWLTSTSYTHHGSGITWDEQLVSAGHVFRILDNGLVLGDQAITNVVNLSGNHTIYFQGLSVDQWQRISGAAAAGRSLDYEIRELPWFALAQILVVSKERTL